MADIVGLVASVLQLVDTIAKARGYLHDFHNAPRDQQRLLLEIENLQALIKRLHQRIERNVPGEAVGKSMQQLKEPLIQLMETVERLARKLGSARSSKISGRLTWPLWGKEDIQEGLKTIERFKSLLSAFLGIDILEATQDIAFSLEDMTQEQRMKHNSILSTVTGMAEEQRIGHKVIIESVMDIAWNQAQYHASVEREEIVDWYSPLNFFLRQADIFDTRHTGTGEWLLQNDHFKAWKSGIGKILWCRGMPNYRALTSSIVVDHLRSELENKSMGVAAIYLSHKEIGVQSLPNLLASLWRQLIVRRPLSPALFELYGKHREPCTRPSLEEMHEILISTVAEYSKAFIIVDALDEYPEEQRHILLRKLSRLGSTVNLMVTSRHHIKIDHAIASTTAIESLEIRATEDDIRCYIDGQIFKSARLSKHITNCPSLREDIEGTIVRRSDGMFLLAKLHIDSLISKHTVKAVREGLNKMPSDLNSTYDEVMDRIDRQSEDDRNLGWHTLSWISTAKRLLHIFELREALAVEQGSHYLDPDNLLDIDTILSVCAGLVIITGTEEDNVVRLVHYTTHDYLDHIRARRFPRASEDITRTCITYLFFDAFLQQVHDPMHLLHQNSLLDYAVEYCLIHARGQPESDSKDLILSFLLNCSVWRQLWNWGHGSRDEIPTSATPLSIAAVFRLEEVCRHLIMADGVGVLLQEAAVEGLIDVVRVLLENGANADASEGIYGTALQAASAHGHENILRLLLDHGANINAGPHGTTLYMTVGQGNEEVLDGDDVHVQVTSSAGHENGASLLVEGTDTNAKGKKHHKEVEVNEMERQFHTALYAALLKGHTEIIRLLVEHGADTNANCGEYPTPLQAAIAMENEEIARLLIECGASVNAMPVGTCGRPLYTASSRGNYELVRLLLQNGAEVNAMGGHPTALYAALAEGHHKIVRLLLHYGADANISKSVNSFGRPLPYIEYLVMVPITHINIVPQMYIIAQRSASKRAPPIAARSTATSGSSPLMMSCIGTPPGREDRLCRSGAIRWGPRRRQRRPPHGRDPHDVQRCDQRAYAVPHADCSEDARRGTVASSQRSVAFASGVPAPRGPRAGGRPGKSLKNDQSCGDTGLSDGYRWRRLDRQTMEKSKAKGAATSELSAKNQRRIRALVGTRGLCVLHAGEDLGGGAGRDEALKSVKIAERLCAEGEWGRFASDHIALLAEGPTYYPGGGDISLADRLAASPSKVHERLATTQLVLSRVNLERWAKKSVLLLVPVLRDSEFRRQCCGASILKTRKLLRRRGALMREDSAERMLRSTGDSPAKRRESIWATSTQLSSGIREHDGGGVSAASQRKECVPQLPRREYADL
ncbi:hypothetical protein FB451DRAFT_1185377 [Mycena latifolia]|nr:hypothetical protein FB451DRAFT_1185377 [Mycena latifolia]